MNAQFLNLSVKKAQPFWLNPCYSPSGVTVHLVQGWVNFFTSHETCLTMNLMRQTDKGKKRLAKSKHVLNSHQGRSE